jgi:hypothetical protein
MAMAIVARTGQLVGKGNVSRCKKGSRWQLAMAAELPNMRIGHGNTVTNIDRQSLQERVKVTTRNGNRAPQHDDPQWQHDDEAMATTMAHLHRGAPPSRTQVWHLLPSQRRKHSRAHFVRLIQETAMSIAERKSQGAITSMIVGNGDGNSDGNGNGDDEHDCRQWRGQVLQERVKVTTGTGNHGENRSKGTFGNCMLVDEGEVPSVARLVGSQGLLPREAAIAEVAPPGLPCRH